MKYVAKVVSSKPEAVTVNFLDKDDKPVSRVTFAPTADQTVTVDKKKVKYSARPKPGTKLDFYIEHKPLGPVSNPDEAS